MEEIKTFLKEMAALASKRKLDCWTLSAGLVLMQTFPVHVLYSLPNLYKHATLFVNAIKFRLSNALTSNIDVCTRWM